MYISSTERLEIPVSYLLASKEMPEMPYVDERKVSFVKEGLSIVLSCGEGDTYYTLDGLSLNLVVLPVVKVRSYWMLLVN